MNIVSGVATAPGISSLLNAPRNASLEVTAQASDPARKEAIKKLEQDSKVSGRQQAPRAAEGAGKTRGNRSSERVVPGNSRYTKFVKAVMALRLDTEAANALTPERVEELRSAAREVFSVTDDIPRDLRPSERALREGDPPIIRAEIPEEEAAVPEQPAVSDEVEIELPQQRTELPELEVYEPPASAIGSDADAQETFGDADATSESADTEPTDTPVFEDAKA